MILRPHFVLLLVLFCIVSVDGSLGTLTRGLRQQQLQQQQQQQQQQQHQRSGPPPRIVIAGPVASGKGTQCDALSARLGVVHLSSGDMLRAEINAGSALGTKAKAFMDSGLLVPDELITKVVCERLSQEDCQSKGWLLDGFPRTKVQAAALTQAGLDPDCVVLLDVPEQVVMERVTGRRTDALTGKPYHLTFNPPPPDLVQEQGRLIQRSDDTQETVAIRYRQYKEQLEDIKSAYGDILFCVDGSPDREDVSRALLSVLQSKLAGRLAAAISF